MYCLSGRKGKVDRVFIHEHDYSVNASSTTASGGSIVLLASALMCVISAAAKDEKRTRGKDSWVTAIAE